MKPEQSLEKSTNVLKSVIELLSQNQNSYAIIYKVFKLVSQIVPIARVEMSITALPDGMIIDSKRDFFYIAFDTGHSTKKKNLFESMVFGTKEKNVEFICIPKDGCEFSQDDLDYLNKVTGILYIHVERTCIRFALEESYVVQKLTGLPNAIGYLRRLHSIYSSGDIQKYTGFFFNIRGFGQLMYDFDAEEVKNISKRYAIRLRELVDEDEALCHTGCDNFAALIKNEHSDEFLRRIEKIEVYGVRNDERVPVEISARIGIYRVDKNKCTHSAEILSQACAAMNYARQKHLMKAEMTPRLYDEIIFDRQVYANLSEAIEKQCINVFYQPKVNLNTGELIGAEALARWNYEKNGELLNPDDFIPVLEKSTRISEMDFFVLKKVCEFQAERKKKGEYIVPISVNFSRRDLEIGRLAEKIDEVVRSYGINRTDIAIEITETAYVDEKDTLLNFLWDMKKLGYITSVDDFGTGNSSLFMIREYPVSEVKIDKSFINRVELRTEDEVVVGAMINLAHKLGIHVIAEGTESLMQIEFLKKLGCHKAQGYFFDKALPKEEFIKRLSMKKYDIMPNKEYNILGSNCEILQFNY